MAIPVIKQINDLLWYLHRRHERRWLERNVEWWERRRAGGRSEYVWWLALRWALTQVVILTAVRYLAEGHFSILSTILLAVISLPLGWFVGGQAWADNERLYERARRGEGPARAEPPITREA